MYKTYIQKHFCAVIYIVQLRIIDKDKVKTGLGLRAGEPLNPRPFHGPLL